MEKWHYNGDVNLREGGFYWREDGADDYVLAVRITPCSDAGGPDNLFYIEDGNIFIGEDEKRIAAALECCGIDRDAATRWQIVDSMMLYAGLDDSTPTVVRIGREDGDASANSWNPAPDVILRGNAKLRRYVEREFLA